MGHRANQTSHGPAGQPRVCVQRNDVANTGHNLGSLPADGYESTSQLNRAKIGSAHAASRVFAPTPSISARSHSKDACDETRKNDCPRPRAGHTAGSSRDSLIRSRQQFFISRLSLAGGIRPIGQQCKSKIAIRIRQIVNLQSLHLLFYEFLRRQAASVPPLSCESPSGTPARNSMRGKGRGPSKSVTTRFIRAIARSEAGTIASRLNSTR